MPSSFLFGSLPHCPAYGLSAIDNYWPTSIPAVSLAAAILRKLRSRRTPPPPPPNAEEGEEDERFARPVTASAEGNATDTDAVVPSSFSSPPPRRAMASAASAGVAALGISGADGEWAAACPPLRRNLHLLAPDEVSAWCSSAVDLLVLRCGAPTVLISRRGFKLIECVASV